MGEKRISTDLGPEAEYRIVLAVLDATRFVNKSHDLKNTPQGEILKAEGIDPKSVYCSIAPSMSMSLSGYPYGYDSYEIDLTKFSDGKEGCDHLHINLYWETGGSCMDSGTPHRYTMCCKCAHSPKRVYGASLLTKFINLFRGF